MVPERDTGRCCGKLGWADKEEFRVQGESKALIARMGWCQSGMQGVVAADWAELIKKSSEFRVQGESKALMARMG
jgi:hypothetical protein